MSKSSTTPPQRDVLINALLVLSNDQVLYENLPSEVRDVCRQAAEALMETSSATRPGSCDVCGAEPGRCMTATICAQERETRSATASPNVDLAKAFLRAHNTTLYGHLIKADDYYRLLKSAFELVHPSDSGIKP